MPYLWDKFNIKTFPAKTAVFSDGVFMPDLSDIKLKNGAVVIDENHNLPVHIIFVGEIAEKSRLEIEITAENQPVFLTGKIANKKPAFLQVFIRNAGKNSVLNGKIISQNHSVLTTEISAKHSSQNTGILIENRVIAHSGSETKLSGTADIAPECAECDSDISFSALAAPDAKLEFSPMQRIGAAPNSAAHSAALWRGSPPQVEYLRESGLGANEIKEVMEEAFMNF
jgi:Fe-S cluster assembly scaffold protein SufB